MTMGLAVVFTRAAQGIAAPEVRVEVHLANGLPAFHLVGMAETTVKEARDRVRSALINSGFEFPARRITVNLAPADIPKNGGRYDLAIAVGILIASGVLPETAPDSFEFVGELGLTGDLKPVKGIIPATMAAQQANKTLLLPLDNDAEASLVQNSRRLCAPNLLSVFHHLNGQQNLEFSDHTIPNLKAAHARWDDIIGQHQAKRALVIAAAGKHNVLFVGPQGTGKSLLANRLVDLLPALTPQQALEVAALHSVKGEPLARDAFYRRPFRAPHHTSSAIALTGGGSQPTPGEISLAHHGVLFLDELPEFGRKALDVLREPLETGDVNISRASGSARFPASFQLVAAMNPSPTGDISDGRTSPDQILRYLNRLSGPLLDRIDLQIEVPRLKEYQLTATSTSPEEDSAASAQQLIVRARQIQMQRQNCLNHQLRAEQLAQVCQMTDADIAFMQRAAKQLKLSMRVFHRTIKVARTIADLNGHSRVSRADLAEGLGYRALDKIIHQLSSS